MGILKCKMRSGDLNIEDTAIVCEYEYCGTKRAVPSMDNEKKINYFTHDRLMRLGKSGGCHQFPERSFFIKGKQFPVCARCTGVLIGQLTAYLSFFLFRPPLEFCIAGCSVMFTDWFIQFVRIRYSNNLRRLITGVIGGYSLSVIFLDAFIGVISCLIKI